MTTTVILSTLSSLVIIYIISRSTVSFGSVYHHIIFGSVADILQSIAMALTTLPMPMEMIYEQFNGLIVVGNNKTCSIQGFLFICVAFLRVHMTIFS